MTVTLIDYTQFAENKLIYTKATRLTQGLDTRKRIDQMSYEEKRAELKYIARSIPSSWEFINYTFEILGVSRAFTHQFVRTRTGSYAQQTTRMLQMERFQYITGPTITEDKTRSEIYRQCMERVQMAYDTLIELGAAVEDARGLLPTNICTNIIAQFNLRTLSDLVKKRWTSRTQGEYRSVVMAMVEAVLVVHPWASDFLIPNKVALAKELEDWLMERYSKDEATKALKLIDLLRKD